MTYNRTDKQKMKNRTQIVAFGLLSAITIASAYFGLAARREAAEARVSCDHWRGVAAKAYTALLLTNSLPAEVGASRMMRIPKGAHVDASGMVLPPDDFCETGLIRCSFGIAHG